MKPFIKWAGGKTRLLKEIEQRLPVDFDEWENVTYVEPFVGGGSVLIRMLQKHKNIKRAIINDINSVLMHSYIRIKDNPINIIATLSELKQEYYRLHDDVAREEFYYRIRKTFNQMRFEEEHKVAFLYSLITPALTGYTERIKMEILMFPTVDIRNLSSLRKTIF